MPSQSVYTRRPHGTSTVYKKFERPLQPLAPTFALSTKGGARKLAVTAEAALNSSLFRLQTGTPWEDRPQFLRYDSGMNCWQRARATGVPLASGSNYTK